MDIFAEIAAGVVILCIVALIIGGTVWCLSQIVRNLGKGGK